MTETPKIKNKGLIFLFIAVFALPVVLAKFALEYNWFNQAATNKGQLLAPSLDMTKWHSADYPPSWKFLYVIPSECLNECQNAIYSLNQLWSALGKEQDRVESVVVAMPSSDSAALGKVAEYKNIRIIHSDEQSVNQVFKDVKTNGIFIVDTLDNIILRYQTQNDQQQAVLHSRDILADMRKVLKLSRIG
ncbi:MAG: hypothetical protein NWQ54_08795 [Paraglaciecola sp.]|uniref:hypothetical protein n=1 Tax=Paraglaciecola sp. TaxID=1920173 RepID=UPI00273FBF74|nr:hypothetical protein [Paraglaciecola sp.]MDP5029850.1 hypothetical protein [Paraglaciecola sp.]MDP5130970.1 hypothetical protein [Paraglaciecola sp.]